jgi:hypothetical protein
VWILSIVNREKLTPKHICHPNTFAQAWKEVTK